MERWKIIELLRNAERDIEEGEKLLATQRRAVEELERNGEPTREAADLLRTFEECYARHLAERDLLRDALSLAPPTRGITESVPAGKLESYGSSVPSAGTRL